MSKWSVPLILAVAIAIAAVALESCSKSSSPTNPSGGTTTGGGGTGGTTLELNGSLAAGTGAYSHVFNTAGSFNYHCTIHPTCPGLAGTIVVVAAGTPIQNRLLGISQTGGSPGSYGTSGTCSALSASRDTVQVGDTVTWTNISPLPHTVTSH